MAVGCRPSAVVQCAPLMLVLALVAATGCDAPPNAAAPSGGGTIESFAGPTMGTRYSVRYVAGNCDAGPPDFQAWTDARLAEINRRMSTYDPESELSRFNQHTGDDWFSVSKETAHVVAYALKLAKESDGAFDPTVGPVVNLWGFGPDGRRKVAPTKDQIEAARELVDYQAVEARLNPPAIRKSKPGVYVDLSAVAKGYASDQIAELLVGEGATACMVEIGGEVATRGVKPDGQPWRIGVEKPDAKGRAIQEVVQLSGEALATSGDYRNFFEADGVRYSHTIDASTGQPVTHRLATVTVRATTCMEADAVATTLLVMGPERGYDWAKERRIAALMIQRTDAGPVEKTTPAWDAAVNGAETNAE